jgi:hypothetical protein
MQFLNQGKPTGATAMPSYLFETVALAFIFGGIVGAVTAIHIRPATLKRVPIRVKDRN